MEKLRQTLPKQEVFGGFPLTSEIRYYKGKYRVEIVLKSKLNYRVKALEKIPFVYFFANEGVWNPREVKIGDAFTTVPRLLWRHPRK